MKCHWGETVKTSIIAKHILAACNQWSQILLYKDVHPLMYRYFLYGSVLFISVNQSLSQGGVGLIHCLAIIFMCMFLHCRYSYRLVISIYDTNTAPTRERRPHITRYFQ